MLGILEDNDDDYELVNYVCLESIQHKRFSTLGDLLMSSIDFDCILTDINLPDSYGTYTVEALRENYDCPIIVLTGVAGPFLTGQPTFNLIKLGANEVISKDTLSTSCDPLRSVILEYLGEDYESN